MSYRSDTNLRPTPSFRFLGYVPVLGKYDSGDRNIIKSHLRLFAEATVDYIIFDFTNNIGELVLDACSLQVHMSSHHLLYIFFSSCRDEFYP